MPQQVTPRIPGVAPPPAPPAAAASSPTPAPVPPVESHSVGAAAKSESNDVYEMYKPFIKPHLDKVLAWAREDRDPQTYAPVFLDEIPRNVANFISQEQALEYLAHPKWFEYICEKESGFANYFEWLSEFTTELMELLKIPESAEESANTMPEDMSHDAN
jgi:hypothetical protein